MERNFVCPHCHRIYCSSSNFSRHLRKVHRLENLRLKPIEYDFDRYIFKCLDGCQTSYATTNRLIDHLILAHKKHIPVVKAEFLSFDDFFKWKAEMEMENAVQYIQNNGKRIKANEEVFHYKCNRSCKPGGIKEDKQNSDIDDDDEERPPPKRKAKLIGSSKINCSCTSQIVAKFVKRTKKVHVTHIDYHYGHDRDLRHLKIPKLERAEIARKLAEGISISRILEDIRENAAQNSRVSMITRKDIYNIKKSYKIGEVFEKKHEDDLVAVELWVKESVTQGEHGVLLLKVPGRDQEKLPGSQMQFEFNQEDFCLIMMTQGQAVMLKQFGSLVCIDSCYGSKCFDYFLVTVLVIDEFGFALPVATMWSNRIDSEAVEIFMLTLRAHTGEVKCSELLSDQSRCFYHGWDSVMGETQWFYNPWSVQRTWQAQLSKVHRTERREEVFSILRSLQEMSDEQQFDRFLYNVVNLFETDPELECVKDYFTGNFVEDALRWSQCRMSDRTLTHSLEVVHKLLDYEFNEGKKTKRIDRAVTAVARLVEDKLADRVNRITGESTEQVLTVTSLHDMALLAEFNIQPVTPHSWQVETKSSKVYLVECRKARKCCDLACPECCVCYHTYRCSCPDYTRRKVICPHIHKVLIDGWASVQRTQPQRLEQPDVQHLEQSDPDPQPEPKRKKQTVLQALSDEINDCLELCLRCTDARVLKLALQTLRTITSLIRLHTTRRAPKPATKPGTPLRTVFTTEANLIWSLITKLNNPKVLKTALTTAKSVTSLLRLNVKTVGLKSSPVK